MHVNLTDDQVDELQSVLQSTIKEMSHEIADTDNSLYRAGLLERRDQLQEVASSLRPLHEGDAPPARAHRDRVWTVEIVFTEDDDRTRADARLHAIGRDWHGWGRARRNPIDPDVPAIGEELAAARALADLSHQLVDSAAHEVERFEGHSVRLH